MKVLSLDAGGIKGIYQLVIIKELERKYGCNFSSAFDLYTGTSIGGVIAIFLATKMDISEVIDELINLSLSGGKFINILNSFFDWTKYKFKQKHFGEISSKVILPVFDFTENEMSHFGIGSPEDYNDIFIFDIIKAICSDYRIMQPHKVESVNKEFIDAGFYAYDPMMYVLKNRETINININHFLSIGSGYIQNISSDLNRDNFFNLMYDSIILDQFTTNSFIAKFFKNYGINYYRISEKSNLKESMSIDQLFYRATVKCQQISDNELLSFMK